MKNYWTKIALGVLLVFGIGMGAVYGAKAMGGKISHAMNSTDPISLPIAFVPFKLNGTKLGSVDKVILLRTEPRHIASAKVILELTDPGSVSKLQGCSLALDDVEHLNEHTTFRCASADSEQGLTSIGYAIIRGTTDSFPLLMPTKAANDLRQTKFELHGKDFNMSSDSDSASDALDARADSIDDASDRVADSMSHISDSLVEGMSKRADSIRNHPAQPGARVRAHSPHAPVPPARP
ncbi:MAG: hypothetical protein ABJD11_14965 [Gemmatimonadota bacterium]